MYYSIIGVLASIILLIENQDILFGRGQAYTKRPWNIYRRFLIAVFLYYLTDVFWGVIEERKIPPLLFADTSVYFIAMAAGVLLWTQYIVAYLDEKTKLVGFFVQAGRMIAVLVTVITLVNLFHPILFRVDENGVYYPLSFRHVLLFLQIGLVVTLSVYAFSTILRRGPDMNFRKGKRYRTLGLFGMIMAGCLLGQLFFPYLPFYAVGYMLGTCLLRAIIISDEKEEFRIRLENAYEAVKGSNAVYSRISQALAHGYMDLVYVNLDTEEYTEYRQGQKRNGMMEVHRGHNFYEEFREKVNKFVYPEDRAEFLKNMEPKRLIARMGRNGTMAHTCRLVDNVGPQYVDVRVTHMEDQDNVIVIGVTDIDEQMQQRRVIERIKEEQTAYARLKVLMGGYLCIYIVDPVHGYYREYSTTEAFQSLKLSKYGMNFFDTTHDLAYSFVHPEDLNRFLALFSKEHILAEIEKDGMFTLSYRMLIEDRIVYVQTKAAMVDEPEGKRLIVGIGDVDAQVRREAQYAEHLAQAKSEAMQDALTGVKNKHAYLEAEKSLNHRIDDGSSPAFAVVILDLNDLKKVNDEQGHQAGDQYLRDACRIICNVFKKSPVYRIGGDEFAVIAQNDDYGNIDALMEVMNVHNAEAVKNGGIVIACGMSRFDQDSSVAAVNGRADQLMYENKRILKEQQSGMQMLSGENREAGSEEPRENGENEPKKTEEQ